MKDRRPKYPGRIKLTPVSGQSNVYDMVRADEPEEAGTPINKQTLLTDEAAEAVGVDPTANPTPADVFRELGLYTAVKVGDVIETVRNDLGERFLLCNGNVVPVGTVKALRDILPYNTGWRKIAPTEVYDTIRPTARPREWLMLEEMQQYQGGRKTAVLYDANTDTCTEIVCPAITGSNSYGIVGLVHDGNRYVLGAYDRTASTVHLYVSSDLATWTDAYQRSTVTAYDMTFDGENIVLLCGVFDDIAKKYNTYVYAVQKTLSSTKTILSGEGYDQRQKLVMMPSGYWMMTDESRETFVVKVAGANTTAFASRLTGEATHLAFYSAAYWIAVPKVKEAAMYLQYVDIAAGDVKYISAHKIIDADGTVTLHGAEYDRNKNEWRLYLRQLQSGEGARYYAAAISASEDPSDMTKYRVERIESLPEGLSCEQMAPDRSQMRIVSSGERYLRDPNQKYLPHHSGDTKKYIYIGGQK